MPLYAMYRHFFSATRHSAEMFALKSATQRSAEMLVLKSPQGSRATFSSEMLALKSATLRRVLPFFQR